MTESQTHHLRVSLAVVVGLFVCSSAQTHQLRHHRPLIPIARLQAQVPIRNPSPARGQDPAITDANTVIVRPAVGSAKRGVPVEVRVDKTRVRVREIVNITLVPKNRGAARFTVNFGDGNEIQTSSTRLAHRYTRVGHYDVFAWIAGGGETSTDPKNSPDTVPRVTLSANPGEVNPGQSVGFVARLSSPYPNIKYRFGFGDGEFTGWQESAQSERAYSSEGSYAAYVDIGVGSANAIRQVGRSARVSIQVRQPALTTVDLTVDPNPAEVGKTVTLTALVVPQISNLLYRFAFGDGSATTSWQAGPQTTHVYANARTHPASVEIGLTGRGGIVRPMGSAREAIRVTPPAPRPSPTPTPTPTPASTPSPSPSPSATASPSATESQPSPSPSSSNTLAPPILFNSPSSDDNDSGPWGLPFQFWNWWYILLALLIAGAAYWGWKALVPPRATFTARPDRGAAEVGTGTQSLSIDSQVILNSNVSGGEYLVYSEEPNIVRSVRRDNG